MGNNIGKDNKMLSELFIAPQINCELMIPPNSREEYLKLLESDIGEDKKLEYLEALLEIYRLENLKNGDKNTEVACREMIGILHKQALNPKLNEQVAYLLIREGAYSEKVHNYENAVRFYESCLSFDVKDPDFRY
ncbi:MAG TPA: hypothetical protein PKG81_08140, partial [Candidatus Omnitrophota bacterium]|nr:hypothetical protein [Candidatus Omnitrophota bacterium]